MCDEVYNSHWVVTIDSPAMKLISPRSMQMTFYLDTLRGCVTLTYFPKAVSPVQGDVMKICAYFEVYRPLRFLNMR